MRFDSQVTIVVDVPMAERMDAKFFRGPAGALLTRDIIPPVTIKLIEATSTRLPLYIRPADLTGFADLLEPKPTAAISAAMAASSFGIAGSAAAASAATAASSSGAAGSTAAAGQEPWVPTLPTLVGVKQDVSLPKPPPPPLPLRAVTSASSPPVPSP